jgi:AcrR family transcriptional regulator
MWISKEGDVRKKEFLDAALCLFCEKGYDKTTVNDIIAKIGVTKGAFYYYFKSKEDVMEAIASSEAALHLDIAKKYSDNQQLNALEKLNGIIKEAGNYNISNAKQRSAFIRILEDEENARLSRRIQKKVFEESLPLINMIIKQGVDEGVFKTEFPEETAELYILLMNMLKNMLIKSLPEADGNSLNIHKVERKLSFNQKVIETALGLETGSLRLKDGLF